MRCAWNELLSILPPNLRREVDNQGRADLRELRLRVDAPPELVLAGGNRWLGCPVTREDLRQCVNNASRYSPWNAATLSQGYLTAPGGHRLGICGQAVMKDGQMTGVREITSICIRVARDIPGIAAKAVAIRGSLLILGAPGWGKTTLLRDLIRQLSDRGEHVAVADQRCELFPEGGCFPRGRCTDVLGGCPKPDALEALLRTMGPDCVAVDEITAPEDCDALVRAAFCGVRLLATAHAGSLADFRTRNVYKPLAEARVFSTALVLSRDKSYTLERMDL